jgi:hypothetical protein
MSFGNYEELGEFNEKKAWTGRDVFPKGKYYVIATQAEMAQSERNPSCGMCKFRLQIVVGQFKKRNIFGQYITRHQKSDVAQIGKDKLTALIVASGGKSWDLDKMLDPELGGRRIHAVELEVKKDANGEEQNEIKKHIKLTDSEIAEVIARIESGEDEPADEKQVANSAAGFMKKKVGF